MDCKYREKDYCTYSNRTCNPNALSCYKTHKPKNYTMAPSSTSPSHHAKGVTSINNNLFPKRYDKTISVAGKTVILVYGGVLKIKKNKLQDYQIIANDLFDPNKKYPLYVICNIKNNTFYMGEQVLKYYIKKNYHPDIIFRYAGTGECTQPALSHDYSEISILKMYGYTVGKSGLPINKRHALLKYLLDNQIMKGHDIINLLQFNIAMREHEPKYAFAVKDWKDDIGFVTRYFSRASTLN